MPTRSRTDGSVGRGAIARRPWPAADRFGADPRRAGRTDPRPHPRPGGQRAAADHRPRSARPTTCSPRASGPAMNGPLLLASTLDPKAHNDQKKLDQLKQAAKPGAAATAAGGRADDATARGRGIPPDQAQQEAEQQVAAQGPSQEQQQEQQAQEQYLKSTASDPRLVHLENQIAKQGDVKSVSIAQVDKSGNAAVFTVIAKSAPSDQRTEDLIDNLRDNVIPEATAGKGVDAHVGGSTAGYMDLANGDLREAAAGDRGRRRTRIHPADDRVPDDCCPGDGRGDEPALGCSRLRGADRSCSRTASCCP